MFEILMILRDKKENLRTKSVNELFYSGDRKLAVSLMHGGHQADLRPIYSRSKCPKAPGC